MVDYSKWNHIEISDDEDDTHPNIDTRSLFKWRHEARVQRMEEFSEKSDLLLQKIEKNNADKKRVKKELEEAKKAKQAENIKKLEASMKELDVEAKKFQEEKIYLEKEEKAQPLNVDTLSQPGFSKTIINKPVKKKQELSEEEQLERSKRFMDEHKNDIKKYGMLHEYHDSEKMLVDKPELACEDTANYLVIWCIDLEVEEKHALMERVAHQTICMQFLMELSKQLEIDPRSAVKPFFQKLRKNDPQYQSGFQDELNAFIGRVKERAQVRIDKAIKEYDEEERQKRLGPGGLDPVEVYETLPKKLQECFDTKDIQMLQDILTTMPEEEARYHLKRCIDSGLWVPDSRKVDEAADSKGGDEKPVE